MAATPGDHDLDPTGGDGDGPDDGPTSLWQSRQIALAVLAGSILIAGAIAAVGLIGDDGDDGDSASTTTTTTALASVTTSPDEASPATSTTVLPGPAFATPTTVAGGSTPSTTPAQQAATKERCGDGSVTANPQTGSVSQDGAGYHLPVAAQVISSFDRTIEVTDLVLEVTFEDGSRRDVPIDTAGVAIPAGDAHTFDGPTVDSPTRPTNVVVKALGYQTQGRSDCRVSG